MFEEDQVREHIHRGFYDLYSMDLEKSCLNSPISSFSCHFFSEKEQERIGREVLKEDIMVRLWALKAFKAPGLNGLHAEFFQHFWHDVKQSVCDEIKNCFAQGCILDYLNETLITLIPKCQCPEILSHYKPINLYNSIYKVISKIIVGRIRSYLSNLITPLQAAFIPRRRDLDNVLIAQEMIYALDRKKGKNGYIAIKVDLEKVYDKLEWSFIHKVLQAFHFPLHLTKLIMSCVFTTSISILVNGSKMDNFLPSRGIRQGDPLSPCLFMLCMKFLTHLIEGKCVEGSWIPLKASLGNTGISHLIFADALILFAKFIKEAFEAISEVLQVFCFKLGQKVSVDKSRICFSPNVDQVKKEEVCEKLGIQSTSKFWKISRLSP